MESSKKYQVLVGKKAEKFLETLAEPYYSAIIKAMYSLADNPRPFSYLKMKGETAYRIRVGNYRIIYDIFEDEIVVEVININHRKDIYKKK